MIPLSKWLMARAPLWLLRRIVKLFPKCMRPITRSTSLWTASKLSFQTQKQTQTGFVELLDRPVCNKLISNPKEAKNMLCIQLKFPNQPGNYWYQLLKNIDFTGCRFAILKDDILRYNADGTTENGLFSYVLLEYDEFMKTIRDNLYHIRFSTIKIYRNRNTLDLFRIRNLEDLSKSACSVLLVCEKSTEVHIFLKDDYYEFALFFNSRCIFENARLLPCKGLKRDE